MIHEGNGNKAPKAIELKWRVRIQKYNLQCELGVFSSNITKILKEYNRILDKEHQIENQETKDKP